MVREIDIKEIYPSNVFYRVSDDGSVTEYCTTIIKGECKDKYLPFDEIVVSGYAIKNAPLDYRNETHFTVTRVMNNWSIEEDTLFFDKAEAYNCSVKIKEYWLSKKEQDLREYEQNINEAKKNFCYQNIELSQEQKNHISDYIEKIKKIYTIKDLNN